ncbi:MAG: energy transducer TonB [Bacteroidia bacterium]|nr:energy transducer TonB [Bacteroidia bacterium]
MKPFAFLILFVCMLLFSGYKIAAQTPDSSMILYTKGIEAFNKANYKKADSLLSLSIKLFPHADTYFSRAACRQKMGNRKGFCRDLGKGIQLGDKEAAKAFCKQCGEADSIYFSRTGNLTVRNKHYYLLVKYTSSLTDSIRVFYNYMNEVYPEFDLSVIRSNAIKNQLTDDPNLYTIVDETANLDPDSLTLLKSKVKAIRIPQVVRDSGISQKSVVRFVIYEDGSIHDPEIISKANNCIECDQTAINFIKSMPRWKPAKVSGKPVKSYFNFPFSFTVK